MLSKPWFGNFSDVVGHYPHVTIQGGDAIYIDKHPNNKQDQTNGT